MKAALLKGGLLAGALTFGCSASNDTAAIASALACLTMSESLSGACSTCLTSSCVSTASSFAGDCSSYVTCMRGCGCGPSCEVTCEAQGSGATCLSASAGLDACEIKSCPAECSLAVPDGGH